MIEKFAIDYPRLNYFHYEITVLEKTDDKWIGDIWTERTRTRSIAHITLERPIIEKVFHHELMHVHLDTIFRPSIYQIQPSFNFDDCKINKRTMWEIGHFASFFEEWFVELYTFEHLYLNLSTISKPFLNISLFRVSIGILKASMLSANS